MMWCFVKLWSDPPKISENTNVVSARHKVELPLSAAKAIPVSRVSRLSLEEFRNKYMRLETPVLIEDGMKVYI